MDARPKTCERASELVSLELDGELSRFERVLLARHLSRCAACADYAAQVTAATEALRRAPVEAVPAPIALPIFQRRFPRVAWNIAATAAVAAFGIWFAVSPSANRHQPTLRQFNSRTSFSTSDTSFWPGGVLPKRAPETPFLPGGQRGLNTLVS